MSFEKLLQLNVNDNVEKKNGLSYLSWSWAWQNFKKEYPTATYKVRTFENGLPYIYDANTGYMVFTEVTVDDLTHEMWLPVMDGANKAMKSEPYTYKTKYAEKSVEAATMFDINKTIMRCLVKNLAMFGLGLYIYAGEDLPEEPPAPKVDNTHIKSLHTRLTKKGITDEQKKQYLKMKYNIESSKDLDVNQYKEMMDYLAKKPDKKVEKKEEAKNEG
jgi:hypothetical protein